MSASQTSRPFACSLGRASQPCRAHISPVIHSVSACMCGMTLFGPSATTELAPDRDAEFVAELAQRDNVEADVESVRSISYLADE